MKLKFYKEQGTIFHKSEVASGVSAKGNEWKSQTIVVKRDDIEDDYANIVLKAFNERVDALANIPEGSRVEVEYSITAKQWNEKWYNEINLSRVTALDTAKAQPAPKAQEAKDEEGGDLPF